MLIIMLWYMYIVSNNGRRRPEALKAGTLLLRLLLLVRALDRATIYRIAISLSFQFAVC